MKNLKIKTLLLASVSSLVLFSCGSIKTAASAETTKTTKTTSDREFEANTKKDTKTTTTTTTKNTNVKLEPNNGRAVQPVLTKKQVTAVKQQQISVTK